MSGVITLSKLKSIVQGQRSQKKGLGFENKIESLLRKHEISFIRIPQSARIVKDKKTGNLITIGKAGPLDFILFSQGQAFLFDCKSTNKESLYRSFFINTGGQKPSSTQKQYDKMIDIFQQSKFSGIGFVINFNETIKFISIKKMIQVFKTKKTLSSRSGISFDSFIRKIKQGKL